MLSQLVKSQGKGQGGTKSFVPLKTVPDKASQPAQRTHLENLWSVNVAYQPKLVKLVDKGSVANSVSHICLYSHRCSNQVWLLHSIYPEMSLCLVVSPRAVLTPYLWLAPRPPVFTPYLWLAPRPPVLTPYLWLAPRPPVLTPYLWLAPRPPVLTPYLWLAPRPPVLTPYLWLAPRPPVLTPTPL